MPTGQRIGHFNLLEEIGHGGMGSVYRAFDPTLDREVAIKVLREQLASNPRFLSDFLHEARSAAAISHPHIIQIHFVGEDSGQYYIVMELVKGRTLRQIIDQDGLLNEERALEIAIDVAEALKAAYKNQMIHGDIKPANIMVTDDADTKVLDFGLAKLANVEVTEAAEIWGSPYYISPERVGQKAEDFRSDVYSLGATLFHVLTGRPPFDAESPDELAAKRLNERPPLLRDLNPNLTAKTEQVVNKMLNKSVLLRYRDYDALLKDLQDAKTEATAKRLGVQLHPEVVPLPESRPAAPPKRSPLRMIVVGIAVIVIGWALVAIFWPRRQPPAAPTHPSEPAQAQPSTPAPPPSVRVWNVEFSLKSPGTRRVFLTGDFNNWSQTSTPLRQEPDGEWVVTLPLKTGRYGYKFLVDGKWTPDPDNPDRAPDGYQGFNSVLTVGK